MTPLQTEALRLAHRNMPPMLSHLISRDWISEDGVRQIRHAIEVISQALLDTSLPPNLTTLAAEFTAWSIPTFEGAHFGDSLKKLASEVDEVWDATTNRSDFGVAEEFADCLMCIFDSAARLGISPKMLTDAFAQKMERNKARQWRRNDDGTYSHVKPAASDAAPL